MKNGPRFVAAAALMFSVACMGAERYLTAPATDPKLCEEFRIQSNTRQRLAAYALEGVESEDGEELVSRIDIDSDGVDDVVTTSCPHSGSIVPADLCSLRFSTSSSKKSYLLEEQGLYAFKYQRSVYVVAGSVSSETSPTLVDIYALSDEGASKICSFEIPAELQLPTQLMGVWVPFSNALKSLGELRIAQETLSWGTCAYEEYRVIRADEQKKSYVVELAQSSPCKIDVAAPLLVFEFSDRALEFSDHAIEASICSEPADLERPPGRRSCSWGLLVKKE